MIATFLRLEWKQYFRSAYWQKSIGIKIMLGFFGLYLVGMFTIMGLGLFYGLKEIFPDNDPFTMINSFLFYYLSADLAFRFFMQKLPVMTVKPLLTVPIKRNRIVHFVLLKSIASFFNFLPLFAILPFGFTLIANDYNVGEVTTWMGLLFIIIHIINQLNFAIENLMSKTDLSTLPVVGVLAVFAALNHFEIVPFASLVESAVNSVIAYPLLLLVAALVFGLVYFFNFTELKNKLYVDSAVKEKATAASTSDYSWTNKFGNLAPFMQLDLKLIMRNKRTKSTFLLLVVGLLYGLFFYPQPMYRDMEFMFAFVGIFSTGAFLINFGQFIPAWDSGYYKMLMSQNFQYKEYLRSKFVLMAMSVVVLFVLGIPYVYFGWKILTVHFAAMIYNIGVNTHVIMWGGSYNRKRINLDQKAAFNYQGTGAVQWLIGIPLMLVPMGLFGAINYFVNFEIAVTVLLSLGVLGIAFHKKIMAFITQRYVDSKYKMIEAFEQEN